VPASSHHYPHVHVWKAGGEVVINLEPVSIVSVEGMKKKEATKAVAIVEANRDFLLTRWREIHG